ncbi:MAG: YARHG domain-containing protein [Rhizobiales bacterium]|nr:YARHG domain-containing protein [Hyphomicrobiales bacterium]
MRHASLLTVLAASALFLLGGHARAACFETIGCTDSETFSTAALRQLSCDSLWTARNTIFHENGYCFQTARGRANFSNDGCYTSDQAAIRLNSYERANVKAITKVEKQKGCR